MTIASLFVKLGINGVDNVKGGLQGVSKGLEGVRSMSLEAKAAIAAAIYGLQRMTAAAGVAGTNLKNFEVMTGLSAQTLQRWQYAGNLAGVAADEVAQNIKGVQDQVQAFALGTGEIKSFSFVAETLAMAGEHFDAIDFSGSGPVVKDAFKLVEQLQKFAQIEKNPVMVQQVLKQFGLSESFITAMQKQAFRPDVFARAPVHSQKAINSLAGVDTAWRDLGASIKFAFEKLTAEHGVKVIKDLANLVPKVLDLVQAFVKLADKMQLFELLGKVFEGWAMIFKELTGAAGTFGERFGNTMKDVEEKGFWGKAKDVLYKSVTGEYDRETREQVQAMAGTPRVQLRPPQQNPNKTTNMNNNVTITNYGQTNPEETGRVTARDVQGVLNWAQRGGQ